LNSPFDIFRVFLRLGLTCFGGPVAHIAYFRREFVGARAWLSDTQFADLLALCQFLPGPASSQLGMAIGLSRGGIRGSVAAWAGFTLPSALLMFFAARSLHGGHSFVSAGALHGLLLVAVAVVVQAVWVMAVNFCNAPAKLCIAVLAAAAVLIVDPVAAQVWVIVAAGALGSLGFFAKDFAPGDRLPMSVGRGTGIRMLIALLALLAVLPLIAYLDPAPAPLLCDSFFRAGALVFGGGHVVLPLLHAEVAAHAWMPDSTFLAGYSAAQAMPGPLFTFAAFLGASTNSGIDPALGALLCTLAIFAPSFLMVIGLAPFWVNVRNNSRAQSMLAAINAAVVGLLLAALYRPIGVSALHQPVDWLFCAIALLALTLGRVPAWAVVLAGALAGLVLG
jgi:chromate transporter